VATDTDATVAGASANSYVLLAEAAAYFATRLSGSLWTDYAATDAVRIAALVTATRRIDAELYRGTRLTSTQARQFPRIGIYQGGQPIRTDVIPDWLKEATCEEALALAIASGTDNDQNPMAQTGLEQFDALAVGDIRLDLKNTSPNDASTTLLSPQAYRLLRPYLITDVLSEPPSGARNVRLVR
jgi:hypothetical protein